MSFVPVPEVTRVILYLVNLWDVFRRAFFSWVCFWRVTWQARMLRASMAGIIRLNIQVMRHASLRRLALSVQWCVQLAIYRYVYTMLCAILFVYHVYVFH